MNSQKNWEEISLKEITTKIGSGVTPRGGSSVYINSGTSLIRSQNIYNGYFDTAGLVFINDETAKKMSNVEIFENDVLINITGDSVARCTIVPNKILPARINQHVSILRCNKNKIEPRFLKYTLISPYYQSVMLSIATGAGATRNALTKSILEDFKINLPPLETQKKIASILSGYDDLIENNLKRIKILEEMAQQTFVSFTQSDHKKLWKSVSLETIIDFHIGGGWGEEEQNEEFSEAGYVIRGTDIDPLKVGNFSKVPFRFHKKSNIKSRELKRGDIVFEVSGGSSNEGVAKTLLITDILLNVFDEKVICASFCKLLRPVNENDSYYLFYFLNYLREVKLTEIYEKRSASNIVNYNWEAFLKYQKILIPTEKELLDFNRKIIPLKTAVINLGIQNQRLREARDILLPRLMMGMIEV